MYTRLFLIGDSLIAFHDWQNRFPEKEIVSMGMPGETVAGLLGRLEHLVSRTAAPDLIMIMTGTNNLAREDYSFLPDYSKIIRTLADTFPEATIAITSLLPIRLPWLANNAVTRLNSGLQQLCHQPRLIYLNLHDLFIAAGNEGKTGCFLADGIHLSDKGYRIWSAAIEEIMHTVPPFPLP